MSLSDKNRDYFIQSIQELHVSDRLIEMNQYIQHGNTSTFLHCLTVAYYSYLLSLRLPFGLDKRSIIRGAMLHDFYLYDWHLPDESHRFHGFHHPERALNNAKEYYDLTILEEDIITKHMWPLTITKLPSYKESILVCLVDKFCSLAETLHIPLKPKEMNYLMSVVQNIS